MLRYFKRVPTEATSLTEAELQHANDEVTRVLEEGSSTSGKRGKYNDYTPEERAKIGKYAAENGPARAVRHFSKTMSKKLPETTARRLKSAYLAEMKALMKKNQTEEIESVPRVLALPKLTQGRPLLLGPELDRLVQNFVDSMRKTGGVVNTLIVMAGAHGIVSARNPALLVEHGGHIEFTKAWAKSLLKRMGYVKRKCSNAGKMSVARFEELKEEFLADVQAEVLMNDIPKELIFNWDQTGLQFVPTGQWTMNRAKEKVIPIASSDDKRQITAVLATTLTGEYLAPQFVFKGTTTRCHPKVSVPQGWDFWHSKNHWSNEETMKRYLEKVIFPFVDQKREALKLEKPTQHWHFLIVLKARQHQT